MEGGALRRRRPPPFSDGLPADRVAPIPREKSVARAGKSSYGGRVKKQDQGRPPQFSPGRIFLKGLIAVLPIALTVYIVVAAGLWAESWTGSLLRRVLPDSWCVPGLGLVTVIAVIFCVGLLMHFWLFERFLQQAGQLLEKLPIVKSIYSALRDLLGYFAPGKKAEFNQVVMVSIPEAELKLFGLVSRTTFADVPAGIGDSHTVAVYLPMSYQIGGYTVYVPRSRITPVDMTLEAAMRFALTAGVAGGSPPAASPPPAP